MTLIITLLALAALWIVGKPRDEECLGFALVSAGAVVVAWNN